MVFGAIVAPVLLLSIFSYISLDRRLEQFSFLRRQAVAYLASSMLRSRFDDLTMLTQTMANDSSLRTDLNAGRWSEGAETLRVHLDDDNGFSHFYLTDLQGNIKARLNEPPGEKNVEKIDEEWLTAVSRNWNPFITDLVTDSSPLRRPEIAVLAPIPGGTGQPMGILVAQISAGAILGWTKTIDLGPQNTVIYTDRRGRTPIYSAREPERLVLADLSVFGPVDQALRLNRGVEVVFDPMTGQEQVAAYEPVVRYGWATIVKQPVSAAFSVRNSESFFLLTVYALIFVFNLMLAFLVISGLSTVMRVQRRERTVFESIGDGLVVLDRRARVVDLNPTAESMFGWSRHDARGKDFAQVLAAQDDHGKNIPREQRSIWQALSGNHVNAKFIFQRRDGTRFPASVTATPMLIDDGVSGAVMVYRDVTKEDELDKAKKEFISIASHQLLTPVSAVKGFLSLLLDGDFGPISGKQREYLEKLYHLNERMIELVEDLLNVSRIDLGVFEAVVEPLDVKEFLKVEVEAVRPLAANKGVSLNEEYTTEDIKLKVSPKLLRNIVQNLISNAIKYTPGSGHVTVRLAMSEDHDLGKSVLFSVKDTGFGIPDAAKSKIFQKFYRADNVRMMGAEGTGLGLYIVKSVMNLFHGKIWFESEEGKGTTFYCVFPLDAGTPMDTKGVKK